MKEQGFFEFQTPILTASSPEGARDFLVPSRVHPGKFYALPQAPQQFKQLIMVAGFDRYFQIAPCFRDEDARADRSPGEFYQLDIEMSFVTQEDVFAAVEPVLRGVFEEFGQGKPVTPVFPRIPYAQAMLEYGVDKPDLRNPIRIADVDGGLRPRRRDLQCLQTGDQGGRGRAGDPRAGRREAAALVLRQAQRLGERGGRPGARLYHLRGRRRGDDRQGADRQVPPRRGATRARGEGGPRPGRRRVLRLRQGGEGGQARRRGPHPHRPGSRADEERRLRILLDRRFPDVRVERGREEDRLLPQPVLDAAGRPRGAPRTRTRSRSRPTSTTSSATASSCPRGRSATIAPMSC